jgi:hemoglobin
MTQSLYERLGGASGVSKLVDRIVDLHLANELIATRYGHLDEAGLARTRAMAKEFFTVGSGGPGTYSGRSMPETHAGMNINAEEFVAVLDDMMKAMSDLDYPRPVCDEVLGIAYSLKGEIVRR